MTEDSMADFGHAVTFKFVVKQIDGQQKNGGHQHGSEIAQVFFHGCRVWVMRTGAKKGCLFSIYAVPLPRKSASRTQGLTLLPLKRRVKKRLRCRSRFAGR